MTSRLQDAGVRVLFFDTFGTCVDWRNTVTDTLWKAAKDALSSESAVIDSQARSTATNMVGYSNFIEGESITDNDSRRVRIGES